MSESKSCYDCVRFSTCSLRHDTDQLINQHLHFFNVDMPNPKWQRIYNAVAEACVYWEERPSEKG